MNDAASPLPPHIPAHVPVACVHPWPLGAFETAEEDPFEVIVPRVHAQCPRAFYAPQGHTMGGGAWVLRDAADIAALLLDNTHLSVSGSSGTSALIDETFDLIPVEIDPPAHDGYRSFLAPHFSPKRMAELDQTVRTQARRLIEGFAADGGCDFIRDFAVPFPVTIFLELLGLPPEEAPHYVAWEHILVHTAELSAKRAAMLSVVDCLSAALQDRRRHPRDDLLTHLVRADMQGRRLSEEEALHTALTLFLAGLDTVTSSLGWHFKHLAGAPDQQERLRQAPALAPAAAEALLRAFAPVTVSRRCVADFHIADDVLVRAGDLLLLSTPLACRDPRAHAAPNEVRFDAPPPHMTFAHGIHHCLGARLARREIQVALTEFTAAIPTFTRADAQPLPMYFGPVLGVKSLPLQW
jgi:cytochrome P450